MKTILIPSSIRRNQLHGYARPVVTVIQRKQGLIRFSIKSIELMNLKENEKIAFIQDDTTNKLTVVRHPQGFAIKKYKSNGCEICCSQLVKIINDKSKIRKFLVVKQEDDSYLLDELDENLTTFEERKIAASRRASSTIGNMNNG